MCNGVRTACNDSSVKSDDTVITYNSSGTVFNQSKQEQYQGQQDGRIENDWKAQIKSAKKNTHCNIHSPEELKKPSATTTTTTTETTTRSSIASTNSNTANDNSKGKPSCARRPRPRPVENVNDHMCHIHVTRLTLDQPPLRLGMAWGEVVCPRLHRFCSVIYSWRAQDGARYRYLLASDQEKVMMLAAECDFLLA
jgi:hypothetical protein